MAHAPAGCMTRASTDRDPRTYALIGAGIEVHNLLGGGFGEGVCSDGFAIELQLRKIPFMTQVTFPIVYKGHKLRPHYRADFVCFDSVVVELKVLACRTGDLEQAQMLNYLRASGKTVGLLLNFGLPSLEHRRFVMSPDEFWRNTSDDVSEMCEPSDTPL
jgi:GxxExxY protein